jgi:serine/threonine protein kinase
MFTQTNSTIGPVCWMAPESLVYRNYSKKSNVWTVGIVGGGLVRYLHVVSLDRPSYEGRTKAVLGVEVDSLHFHPAR